MPYTAPNIPHILRPRAAQTILCVLHDLVDLTERLYSGQHATHCPDPISTTDYIHWTRATVENMLQHRLAHLKLKSR